MGLGIFVEAWNNYGIQMLVLMSLVLQLLMFILPIVRRHKMLEKWVYPARLCKLILWLAYLLADTTAIYVLGHMAISSHRLPGEVMALWASLLLVHLGGQDTMTAYSLEDNRLWKRHLLILLVQTAGVVYALHGLRGAGGGPYPRLRIAGPLMFVVGFLKFVERIWVLRASSDMNKLFTRQEGLYIHGRYQTRFERYTAPSGQDSSERAEEDLKQAHGLLYFCMCQFVDDKSLRPSPYQTEVIHYYAREKRLCELVHLLLSLMHDLLYTKAAAIHTWYGFLLRVFSWIATATTCTLVFLSGSSYGGRRLDAAVTYALLAGALLLETASSLKAAGSTWTYETLRSKGWYWYSHNCVVKAFQRLVRAAECGLGRVVLAFRRLVRAAEWSRPRCTGYIGGLESTNWVFAYCTYNVWWSAYGQTVSNTRLFVDEIEEMVTAYCKEEEEEQQEKLMNSRGGLSLPLLLLSGHEEEEQQEKLMNSRVKLIQDLEQLEFDEYLVLWYYATIAFTARLPPSSSSRAVQELSEYMMYLFKKQPHMLPSPVRQKTHSNFFEDEVMGNVERNLMNELKLGDHIQKERKLKAVLWVLIEMLCYAASHCNRESHARELSNGSPEFATVLWVVRAALINANMKLLPKKKANMKPPFRLLLHPNYRGAL